MKTSSVQPVRNGPSKFALDSPVVLRESQPVSVHVKSKKSIARWQKITIVRRLAAIAAAIQYVNISMSATWWALKVSSGADNPTETLRVFPSSLILGYLGEGQIRDSPMVQRVLNGDTSPRDYALFLETDTQISTTKCSSVPLFNPELYNYKFLSERYQGIVADTRPIILGDRSGVRVFNLVRSQIDPSSLYIVTMSLNIQEYEVHDFKKKGPAMVGMLTLVQDMQAETVSSFYMVATTYPYERLPKFELYDFVGVTSESYLELHSIPRDPLFDPVKRLFTARKRGFFNGNAQYNVRQMYTILDGVNATTALTRWDWIGEAVTGDAYAWVHCIHFIFGLQTIYSLIVLSLVMYQKIRSGKVWIGDPFASLSTADLVLRGILVLASCFIDNFWSVNEYAMSRASMLTNSQTVHVHKEIMQADIMVIFLSLVGFISSISRERIDPSVAIFLFEFIHTYRLSLLRTAPAIVEKITTYSDMQWDLGIAKVNAVVGALSPMRMWSSFQFPPKDPVFIIISFFPTTYLLIAMSGLAIIRKLYRCRNPDRIHISSQNTNTSGNEVAAMTTKGIATNFEISTGAVLQTRYGLITDYNNYVVFKGMKFASPDGVYCAGYVIVNEKLLVSTKNLLAIMAIKVLHARFTNVYAYEVDGNTVKQTAKLVHPNTLKWSDLWRLNVAVLL